MAEVLAELVARITADASELKKALAESERNMQETGKTMDKETKSMSQSFKELGKAFAIVGAAITATMTGVVLSFAKTGSELHDLALKTGVSVEALAGLKYAAEQNGASLGTVEMAIKRTSMAMSDIRDGSEATTKTFEKLGLSLSDLEGLNVEQQFLLIANAIATVSDPMSRAAIAVDLFGRSGTDMLPMLSEGADGLKKLMEQGVILTGWTNEGAKSADALGDAFDTLKTSTMGLFNTVGSSLAPMLKNLADNIIGVTSQIKLWADEHPGLTQVIATTTLIMGGMLTVGGSLLLIIPKIVGVITALKIAMLGLNVAMGPVGWIIAGISAVLLIALPLMTTFGEKTEEAARATYNMVDAQGKLLKGLPEPISLSQLQGWGDLKRKIDAAAEALDPKLTEAEKVAAEAARKLWDAENKLSQSFGDLLAELRYNDSTAKAYNLTMDDVYEAMGLLGYSTEDIRKVFNKWGTDVNFTQFALDDLGLSAREIAIQLGRIKEETDAGAASFKKYGEVATQSLTDIRNAIKGTIGATREAAMLTYNDALRLAAAPLIAKGVEPTEAYNKVRPELTPIPAYQAGGIVGNTGLAYLHEGETVLPAHETGGVTVNFTQPVFFDREDIMNVFIKKIAIALNRDYRLVKGAGLYG